MLIIVIASMIFFGITHSYTAGQFKNVFRSRFGDRAYYGLYRVFYNLFAVITLVPISYLFARQPGNVIWRIDLRWEPVLMAIQFVGLVGLVISLLQIDLGRFLGITQLFAYFRGKPLPLSKEELQVHGLYAFVRHPLYLFSMLATWPVMTMTEAYLGFCVGMTIYFIVGSLYEERRLVATFEQSYAEYQRRVPWLIPFLRRGNKT